MSTTTQMKFVGCEDCCDDVTKMAKELHGHHERTLALMAEVAELKVNGEDLTLDVDEGRVLLERSHERNRKLTEQYRGALALWFAKHSS